MKKFLFSTLIVLTCASLSFASSTRASPKHGSPVNKTYGSVTRGTPTFDSREVFKKLDALKGKVKQKVTK